MRNKKVIMILIGICIIAIIIAVISIKVVGNKQLVQEVEKEEEIRKEVMDQYASDKVTPRGISSLYGAYKGDYEKNDLYRNLNYLVQYLPDLHDDIANMKDDALSKYFDENKSEIGDYLGIKFEDQFIEFAKYIQTIDFNGNTFNSAEIDTESYDNNGSYLKFNLELIYDDLDTPVNIQVSFSKYEEIVPEFIYNVAE